MRLRGGNHAFYTRGKGGRRPRPHPVPPAAPNVLTDPPSKLRNKAASSRVAVKSSLSSSGVKNHLTHITCRGAKKNNFAFPHLGHR